MKFLLKIILLPLVFSALIIPQEKKLNQYGLYVIDNTKDYIASVEEDSTKMLVDLQEFIPGLKIDVKYATDDNFLGEKVYDDDKTFLRLPAAQRLQLVQDTLKKLGLELKIFDAYRPYSITVKMYETYKDTEYVASAWTGSRHNRGCAVDLTIVSSETGEELKMPTPYDDFTEKANAEYVDLPEEAIINRRLLRSLMEQNGFKVYPSEWWHYDFEGWKSYELMDLDFEELKEGVSRVGEQQ